MQYSSLSSVKNRTLENLQGHYLLILVPFFSGLVDFHNWECRKHVSVPQAHPNWRMTCLLDKAQCPGESVYHELTFPQVVMSCETTYVRCIFAKKKSRQPTTCSCVLKKRGGKMKVVERDFLNEAKIYCFLVFSISQEFFNLLLALFIFHRITGTLVDTSQGKRVQSFVSPPLRNSTRKGRPCVALLALGWKKVRGRGNKARLDLVTSVLYLLLLSSQHRIHFPSSSSLPTNNSGLGSRSDWSFQLSVQNAINTWFARWSADAP